MKIAVTGAGGFIGRQVVDAALRAGHDVVALVRSEIPAGWKARNHLRVNRVDLLKSQNLGAAIEGCDALVHLAAVMRGANQYASTLRATERVLAAMDAAGIKKLVGLSSISVLDYVRKPPLAEIDEDTAMNPRDAELGPYARMKRDQEALFRQWRSGDKQALILRPGLVYDRDHWSSAHVGVKFLAASHSGRVPVVHVASVADAIVAAASSDLPEATIQLVNDKLPKQAEYIAKLRNAGVIGSTVALPWRLFSSLLALARAPLQLLGKTPDSLHKNSVAARQKPFVFSNQKAKELLHWQTFAGLQE